MSSDRALESAAALVQQPAGDADVTTEATQGRWSADSAIPARCTDRELLRGLGYSKSRFYRLKASGAFGFLEVQPQLAGAATVYSGRLIAKWLSGERTGQPRQFFQAGARKARA